MKFEDFLANSVVKKYPNFLKHAQFLWPCHCVRSNVLIHGNNTNNLSEAGVLILKEIVFSHVKAYIILLKCFNL